MSSKTNRPDRRSDYRHFPEAYSELFEQFKMNGTARLGPMPHTNALGGRRDLYRYRTYLISAVETDPDDDYARNLYDAARDVTMRVEGAGNRCFIVLELNPIVAAMRNPEATSEAREDMAGEPFAEGESRQTGESCPTYCGAAACYVGSEDDIGPEKFRCMKSTAPARIIQ